VAFGADEMPAGSDGGMTFLAVLIGLAAATFGPGAAMA
jgi:hypothetical protein